MNPKPTIEPNTGARLKIASAGKLTGIVVFLLICAGYLYYSTRANLDLTQERAVLFMDEQIIHDGITRIYDSKTPGEFCSAVLDGYDQRYGRILYNLCALTSYVPYRMRGEPGLIVATRTTITLILLTAYIIFVLTLIDGWWWRNTLLLALVLLPFTTYYATMPKPEPLQLLFLALFLRAAQKRQFRFGLHWFFAGLAFGAKISALPIVFVFGCAALWEHIREQIAIKSLVKSLASSVGIFVVGWIVAVPVIASFNLAKYQGWWSWTFGDMTHGADDRTVTILTWISHIFNGNVFETGYPLWFSRAATIGALLLMMGAVLAFSARLRRSWKVALPVEVILSGVALASTLPIMLEVKRTWGMYLHVGMVFGCIASMIVLIKIARWIDERLGNRSASFVGVGACLGVFAVAAIPPNTAKYDILAHRTDVPYYKWQIDVYHQARALLAKIQGTVAGLRPGTNLNVLYDPILYTPTFKTGYYIAPIWGPITEWPAQFDVVVLSEEQQMQYLNCKNIDTLVPPSSASYANYVAARKAYRDNVQNVAGHGAFALYKVLDGQAYIFINTKRLPFVSVGR